MSFEPPAAPLTESVAALGSLTPGSDPLRGLAGLSRALTYATSMEQVARLTVERGAELLGADSMVLVLVGGDGTVHLRAAHGVEPPRIVGWEGALTDDDVTGRLQELLGVSDDCFVAVPLVVGGEVTGIAAAGMPGAATTAVEWLLAAVGDQAAVALENARLGGEVRLEMEDRLRASEGATSAKDRALATLAHDIRSPLGAIEGYCGILEAEIHGPLNQKQLETLDRVRLSGRHLLSLLDSVMDIARLNAGVTPSPKAPVRVLEAVQEAIHILSPAADARLQTLSFEEPDDLIVLADHERLRQIMVNLVGNAVKFTPLHGSITITVRPCVDKGVPCAEIRVTDSGPGVPPAEQAAIFQPYYRSESTSTAPGIGLGLAISSALVEQMGGQLTLESGAGGGACFIVRLPIAAHGKWSRTL